MSLPDEDVELLPLVAGFGLRPGIGLRLGFARFARGIGAFGRVYWWLGISVAR